MSCIRRYTATESEWCTALDCDIDYHELLFMRPFLFFTQINYTEDELRTFANRAAKMASKNLQAQNSEDSNGLAFATGGKRMREGYWLKSRLDKLVFQVH